MAVSPEEQAFINALPKAKTPKRLSDCPAERLAECRGELVPPAGDVEVLESEFLPDGQDEWGYDLTAEVYRAGPVDRLVTRLTAERDGLNAERLLLRDALDHIARTCGQSRTDTRRLRWIECRANTALEGKPYDARLLDLPINGDKRDLEQRRKIERLQSDLTKARELLTEAAGKLYVDTQLKLRINAFNAHQSAPAAPNQAGEQP